MGIITNKINFFSLFFTFFLAAFLLLPDNARSEETYKFEHMWPTLQQPWYFVSPNDISLDSNGFVYVADTWNNRIVKFSQDGIFITTWGYYGSDNGEFDTPYGIAIDNSGFVYIADTWNDRVQKFDQDGKFITKWGVSGTGNGELSFPFGIAVDNKGFVYVADEGNHRIQKFSPDGTFITKWGSVGTGDGQFNCPADIAVDNEGFIYVAGFSNHRIQKFSPDGAFITKWGSFGTGDGELNYPYDIAIDNNGFIYVADTDNDRIQKFNSDGVFITKWGGTGKGNGEFRSPRGLDANSNFVYVADFINDRIQKFSSDGTFITKWGSVGAGDGEFYNPYGIAVDNNGFIYVPDDANNRVQKFSSDGIFITEWGIFGSGDGEFKFPADAAVDSSGFVYIIDYGNSRIQKFNSDGSFEGKWGSSGTGEGKFRQLWGITADNSGFVYVADSGNHRIQKFNQDGVFIKEWGGKGTEDGKFNYPHDIVADNSGFIYVTDEKNHRIQKFDQNGVFQTKWGQRGTDDGEFEGPWGITVDNSGFVYVADTGNNRIQKFTTDGQFVTKWGSIGSEANYFSMPSDLAVFNDKIFITDLNNNRIQVFNQVSLSTNNKAIIVAAGGPFDGNNLWDATQMSASFAYRTLTYQGFTKNTIKYLSSDINLDLDNNGEPDDVDGDATNANLQDAITNWALDADNLILYIVDHGGDSVLRMSGTEIMSAAALDAWLDTLQAALPGRVTVVYDACESGSFISALTPPSGKDRVVITSTSPGESAYFVTQGTISFSNYFWTQIFNGNNIKDSFEQASDALGQSITFQTPLLDDNNNGVGNESNGDEIIESGEDGYIAQNIYIGNGTVIYGDAPVIGSVSDDQTIDGTATATLIASNVTDNDGIAHVWAVIRTPNYNQGPSDSPVQGLPSIDLMPMGEDRYEATYEAFNTDGTYQIAIYARDRMGNTSIPEITTVSVDNPTRRKAIIVAGGSQSDTLWPAIETNAQLAYDALKFQGYSDYDIYFMSPVTFSAGVDGTSTLGNLEYAVTTWAASNTHDVVLFMIGNGDYGTYDINDTERLSSIDLDRWIDSLQDIIPGKVTFIYDANQSGNFISRLTPPVDKERILISSTEGGKQSCFLSNGDIAFSKYFWSRVANGANVRDAFIHAKKAMKFTYHYQTAQLDDNGNGTGNEKEDGIKAMSYTIGAGIMLAGDDPVIGSIMPAETLTGQASATIWAEDVTTTGNIENVWAVINPPGYDPITSCNDVPAIPKIPLSPVENNRYEGADNIFANFGTYEVIVYAMDDEGNMAAPLETTVQQLNGPDIYEDDDTYDQANIITLNNPDPQLHNSHDTGDEDWVMFYGLSGRTYEVLAENLGTAGDVVIELYDSDVTSPPLDQVDDAATGGQELLSWTCPEDGVYYVRVRQHTPSVSGENTEYDLKAYDPTMTGLPLLRGIISNASTALAGVLMSANGQTPFMSDSQGEYTVTHPPGTVDVVFNKNGYNQHIEHNVTFQQSTTIIRNIRMYPTCTTELLYRDYDGDNYGDENVSAYICPQANWVTNSDDYNDFDEYIHPGGHPFRILGVTDGYYQTLDDAYNAASNGDTIQCQVTTYTGNFNIDSSKSVTIEGGYNNDYETIIGTTIIKGNISSINGTVTFENITVE